MPAASGSAVSKNDETALDRGLLSGISPFRPSSFEAGVVRVAAATSPLLCALVTGAICSCACGSTTGGGPRSTVVFALSLRPQTPPPQLSESSSTSTTESFRGPYVFSIQRALLRSIERAAELYLDPRSSPGLRAFKLHDLDAALPGRLRRGRCACPPPPLASRAHRWRPLLSRPRGAVGSWPAAVELAAVSAVALTCGLCVGGFGWL
jgi:hypothetical protein